ncbi:hypothetical protein B1H10_00195 [candidate division KSB1 bacterium 4484_188]|nr:MAG: hypothetical protein B1H10_00195 [candidate division KSB1 bacterium 4484_188]
MKYSLKYGSNTLEFILPEQNVLHFINVKQIDAKRENRDVLQEALKNPVAAPALQSAVKKQKLTLLVEDATRDVAIEDILAVLVPHLKNAASVTVIICSGTHDPNLPANQRIKDALQSAFAAQGIRNNKILVNDSRNGEFDEYGITTIGNRVLVNRAVNETEVFLTLSDMKNHYFAGYSCAVKNYLPGICAYESTEYNHALALLDEATFGQHPWHPEPDRRTNPVAADMVEAFHMIVGKRPAYALATIEKTHQILWAQFGDLKQVTQNGIVQVDHLMSQKITPADLLIVSSGGYPNDESIYTAQRALDLSKDAVKPGGKILFLAECRNGISPCSAKKNFFDILAQPLSEVLKLPRKKYLLYSHKAYKLARLIQRVAVIGVHTKLSPEEVETIHLKYVTDPAQFVRDALQENPQLTINLVNDGNKIALLH